MTNNATLVLEGFIKMPHLKSLNLNYNRIGNARARTLAKLLSDESSRAIHTIHTLSLARNKIYNAGGKALAWTLAKNYHLTHLDIRLNRSGNSAGRDFGLKNKSLLFLSIGANRLTADSAYIFGKMLHHNSTLRELDLSSNDIGKKGGEFVALGIRSNKNILRVDIRLANIGLDFEYDMGTHFRKNRNRILGQYSLVERDGHYSIETESDLQVIKYTTEDDLTDLKWNDENNEGNEEEEAIHGDHNKEKMMSVKRVKEAFAMKGSYTNIG